MIPSSEAFEIIDRHKVNWGEEMVAIENSCGRLLKEDIFADRDFPPFDRVTMDGIAIRNEDFLKGQRDFEITDVQLAGEERKELVGSNCALEVMTGAVLPKNADIVIRYEDVEIKTTESGKIANVRIDNVAQWKNVHKMGSDNKQRDLLLPKGTLIKSADISVLGTVGKHKVLVSADPKVAIISTGDELVPVEHTPEAHQIRMSNSVSIQAHLNEMGIQNQRFHLNDDFQELKIKFGVILKEFDVILLSGGVSKGKADYVPEVLEELGVEKLFHRVAQRPGKPFWFGKKSDNKFVFALPGNPVSTFMCFVVYFLPWMKMNLGINQQKITAVLSEEYSFKPALTYFLQVKTTISEEGVLLAEPCEGGGSGDLTNLVRSDAFIEMPAEKTDFVIGECLRIHPFRSL